MSQDIVNKTTIDVHDPGVIPRRIGDKALHRSNVTALRSNGDRPDCLALEVAELTGHVPIEILTGFATLKTFCEVLMKPFAFGPYLLSSRFSLNWGTW